MAVDTSAVQITINVVDGNSGEVVSKVTQSLEQLGAAGATNGQRVKQGMDTAGAGALSSTEKTRLLTEEFGVRLPRAMMKMIAQSKIAQAALNAIGTGLIALGAIQIGVMVFTQLIDGAKKLWDNYFSLTSAAEKYNDELMKARTADFGNTRSIEDTRARIQSATDDIKSLDKAIQAIENRPFLTRTLNQFLDAHKFAELKAQTQKQLNDLQNEQLPAQRHELTLAAIARDHSSAGLTGAAARQTALDRKLAENKENQAYEAAQDRTLHNTTSSNAGAEKQAIEDATARKDAAGEAGNAERSQERETMRMQAEAREARLHGEQLYAAQRDAMLDTLRDKYKDTELSSIQYARQRAAVLEKYDNERLKRLEDIRLETAKIEREAEAAGMTGIAKIQAEGAGRVQDLNDDKRLNDYPAERARQIAAANKETNASIAEDQKGFSEEIDQIVEESQTRQLSGFERIQAEANKARTDLQKRFDTQTNLMDLSAPGAQEQLDRSTNQFGRGLNAIDQSADRQSAELTRHNADETAQIEAEARAKWLSAEKQQSVAIETEYEERLRKYKEQLDQREISDEDYNRRALAAEQLKDAQLVEASKAAREKMAGEFSRFFRDPSGSLKELGDKAAGEAAAAMVQRVQNHFGGAGASASEPGAGKLDGLFDRIAGHGKGADHAGLSAASKLESNPASIKAISLSTAEIHIQSANIGFSGAGAAGGSFAGTGTEHGSSTSSGPTWSSAGATRGVGDTSFSSTAPVGITGTPGVVPTKTDALGAGISNVQQGMNLSAATRSGANGGAGDTGFSSTAAVGITGTPGVVPTKTDALGTGISYVNQGMNLGTQAMSIGDDSRQRWTKGMNLGGSESGSGLASGVRQRTPKGANSPYEETQGDPLAGKLNADGSFTSAGSTNKGMLGGGGFKANAEGAAGGALGLFSAYEGNGGVGGAVGGAMSGMQLGMSLGGPIGAGIGAAAGAVLGAIGFGGREKARVYDLKQVRPRIANDTSSYEQGAMDYLSAYSDMQSMDVEAKKTTNSYGPAARSYYQDTIKKEIHQAEGKFTSMQKAGRSQFTATAAQYDWGGPIDNFGTMGTTSGHGFVHAQQGEYVVEQQQANTHAGALNAINSGATHADMAKYYGADSGTMPAASSSSGDVHLHLNAIDAKSSTQWLMANKHTVRAAINSSYAENSGGADA